MKESASNKHDFLRSICNNSSKLFVAGQYQYRPLTSSGEFTDKLLSSANTKKTSDLIPNSVL